MKKAKNILIIDDDSSVCLLLERILSEKYTVNCCNNAMDALCWLTEGNFPDLIVTDIIMPALTGIELLEKLRESGLFRGIPVVILSGLDDPDKKRRSVELGANSFLRKPFTPEALLETIHNVMECRNDEKPIKLNDEQYV